jgi:hypothetical protein
MGRRTSREKFEERDRRAGVRRRTVTLVSHLLPDNGLALQSEQTSGRA